MQSLAYLSILPGSAFVIIFALWLRDSIQKGN